MNIFPAIDLYNKNVVRLYKGRFDQMTVYGDNPLSVAKEFENAGAKFIHVVDLEGAKTGSMPNAQIVSSIKNNTNLFVETGGGIRDEESVKTHIGAGVDRIILGTAAIENLDFLQKMLDKYGSKIAVGIDIKDGYVAVKGWTEKSNYTAKDLLSKFIDMGLDCVICTDISKDGAMSGTNLDLYKTLQNDFDIKIIASGGVSSIDDVKNLADMNLYGAIIGKAYYTGAIDLAQAIEVA